MSSSTFDDLLAELRVEYLQSFPERISNIRVAYSTQSWSNLETEVHKLKGTGKTYGLASVSQVSRQIELKVLGAALPPPEGPITLYCTILERILSECSKSTSDYDLEQCGHYQELKRALSL